jgi:hypothetical protein
VNGKADCQSAREYNEIWREFQEGQLSANIVIRLTRRAPSKEVFLPPEEHVDSLFKSGVFRGVGTGKRHIEKKKKMLYI